ncbi:type II toxin-antitoxin system PemK/MazF family toxin [Candidatus Saccharibacteria bacterium]|nr:type II toxin-antitoxin system PemK/MazF family toxin [Candidatus Saccharibacteria bacterium]
MDNNKLEKSSFIDWRDYKKWMPVKQKVHNGARFRTFSEGQIWWCVLGENVGVEINGKGDYFLRPVYIFKKKGKLSFIGIPLTTQAHEGYGYVKFRFKDKYTYAVLSQITTVSVFRLMRKMGEADDSDVKLIHERLGQYLDFLD